MKRNREFSAMLWVNALAILVFGAGLVLLAFYMSFEIGVIASVAAGIAVVGIAVTWLVMRAVKKHRAKESLAEASEEERLA